MKNISKSTSCILLILLSFSIQGQQKPTPKKVYEKDGIEVAAYDFDGLEYFLNLEDDVTYIVNFWATWCMPCIEELPYFEEITKKYPKDKVKVILVSLDMQKQVESRLLPFIKKKKLKSEVVYLDDIDANSWINKVDPDWSGAIPATVIYKNKNRKFYERSFTFTELENEIKLINQKL